MAKPQGKQALYLHLLKDDKVRRWFDNMARKARNTADQNLRMLGLFCKRMDTTPAALVEMSFDERSSVIEDYIGQFNGARPALKSLRSWFSRFQNVTFRIPNVARKPRKKKDIPTPEELKAVFNAGDARSSACLALVALAGQRLATLGNYDGTDGICLADMVDLHLPSVAEQQKYHETGIPEFRLFFEKMPARVIIRDTLSKIRVEAFTYLIPEAAGHVTKYLRERIDSGEILTATTAFIVPKAQQRAQPNPQRKDRVHVSRPYKQHPYIRTINISDLLRKPMKIAGVVAPPSVWRSYFSTMVHNPIAYRNISKDQIEFTVGHSGSDISKVYALHQELPDEQVEALRKGFASLAAFVGTQERKIAAVQQEEPRIAALMQLVGLKDTTGMSAEQIAAVMRDRLGEMQAQAVVLKEQRTRSIVPEQKIVTLKEMEESIGFGWRFVHALADGRYIISRN